MSLRSHLYSSRCASSAAPIFILKLASWIAVVAGSQDADSSLNEVLGGLNMHIDAEELQMTKNLLGQDSEALIATGWRNPPGVDPPASGEVEQSSSSSSKDNRKPARAVAAAIKAPGKGAAKVQTQLPAALRMPEDAPLELTTEDDLFKPDEVFATPAHASKASSSSEAKKVTNNAEPILHSQLVSEEKYNTKLKNLLQQSAAHNRKYQQKVVALQTQLTSAMQQQKRMRGSTQQVASQDHTETARLLYRAETAEKKLQRADQALGSGIKTIHWLRERVKTLLNQVGNATHIGKVLQRRLAAATRTVRLADSNSQMQHLGQDSKRLALVEAQLHEAQENKVTTEDALKSLQRQNLLLEQRMQSLQKRDGILNKENSLLRGKLHDETAKEQQTDAKLQTDRASITAEMQRSSMQMQRKYADSLKALMVAQAGVDPSSHRAGPIAVVDTESVPPPAAITTRASPVEDSTEGDAPSSLLELGRGGESLTALMQLVQENKLLRGRLYDETTKERQTATELRSQLARADVESDQDSFAEDSTEDDAPSSLLETGRESKSLATFVQEILKAEHRKPVHKLRLHDSSSRQLDRNGHSLGVLLQSIARELVF